MINIGIIGFGYMGLFHLEKVKQFDDMRVTCAFDTDAEKRQKAEEAGLKAYDRLEDFLQEELELVVIATPNQWHAPYAIAAMKAGETLILLPESPGPAARGAREPRLWLRGACAIPSAAGEIP